MYSYVRIQLETLTVKWLKRIYYSTTMLEEEPTGPRPWQDKLKGAAPRSVPSLLSPRICSHHQHLAQDIERIQS